MLPNPTLPKILPSVVTGGQTRCDLRPDPKAVESVAAIRRDPRLLAFFQALEKEAPLRRIMFAHRRHHHLLENIEVPLLYGDSPPDSPVDRLKLESAKAAARSEANLLVALDRFWPNLEQYVKGVVERTTAELAAAGDAEHELTESEGAQISISLAAQMLFPPGSSGDPVDRWFKRASKLGGDIIPPLIDTILSMPKAEAVVMGRRGRAGLASALGMSEKEYQATLERLHLELQVIAPLLAILWCTKCRENPYSAWVAGLRQLPNASCPTCDGKLASGAFYYFDPGIARLMRQDDGLLAYATFWVAESSGVEWCPRAHFVGSEKFEHDIVFLRKGGKGCGLIEVKVLALDASTAAKKSNVLDGFAQLADHLGELTSLGISVSDIMLVTNYNFGPQTEALLKSVRGWDQFREYEGRIELFGIDDFPHLRKYLSG